MWNADFSLFRHNRAHPEPVKRQMVLECLAPSIWISFESPSINASGANPHNSRTASHCDNTLIYQISTVATGLNVPVIVMSII